MRKERLDVLFFVVGTFLVISAAFISLLIVPRYDGLLTANERKKSTLTVKLQQLSFSWNDFINYGALDVSYVNTKNLMQVINATSDIDVQQAYNISQAIQTLETLIVRMRRSALSSLSRYFDVNDTVRAEWQNIWNTADLPTLNDEMDRMKDIYYETRSRYQVEETQIEEEMALLRTQRNTLTSILPIVSILGTIILQYSTLLHWEKGDSRREVSPSANQAN